MRKLILTGVVFALALALASAAVAKAKTLYFNGGTVDGIEMIPVKWK